jgi:hypothetical protein
VKNRVFDQFENRCSLIAFGCAATLHGLLLFALLFIPRPQMEVIAVADKKGVTRSKNFNQNASLVRVSIMSFSVDLVAESMKKNNVNYTSARLAQTTTSFKSSEMRLSKKILDSPGFPPYRTDLRQVTELAEAKPIASDIDTLQSIPIQSPPDMHTQVAEFDISAKSGDEQASLTLLLPMSLALLLPPTAADDYA